MNFKVAIIKYFHAPLIQSFAQFRWGVIIFFIGLVVIYIGSVALTPSLAQEIITLVGLIVIAIGFITAIMAQVRMTVSRLLLFFKGD